MKILKPINGIGKKNGVYLTQEFGNVWIATQDMVLGGISIKKGDNVYKVAFKMDGHNGEDYAAPHREPAIVVHDGFADFYGDGSKGYGYNARLTWTDISGYTYECVYGHLDKHTEIPREVKAGEVIGWIDNSGFSTDTHLHFGIRKLLNGTVVDYDNGYFGYFNPQPFYKKETSQVVYKELNKPVLYFPVGSVLIPFATDYTSYLEDFADAVVVELPASEFKKFKVANKLKVKL